MKYIMLFSILRFAKILSRLLFTIIFIILFNCCEYKNKNNTVVSDQTFDSVRFIGDTVLIKTVSEFKFLPFKSSGDTVTLYNFSTKTSNSYNDLNGNVLIIEDVTKTMEGSDSFYKIFSRVRAFDISTKGKKKILWDSTFKYELGTGVTDKYFQTNSPSCCASEDDYNWRDIRTGKLVLKYTFLKWQGDSLKFYLGYNAARGMNFNREFWTSQKDSSDLIGELFTFKEGMISKFDVNYPVVRHDISSTPIEIIIVNQNSVSEKAKAIAPNHSYFVKLRYDTEGVFTFFIPISKNGVLDLVAIAKSDTIKDFSLTKP
jgi:hypothetical protein